MTTKETLVYSDWFHPIFKQSQYAPTMVEDEEESYLTCPGCGAAHRDIEHSTTKVCRCGLYMQRYGNSLHIWKETPA